MVSFRLSYKVKLGTLDESSPKYKQMFDLACNYLYRQVVRCFATTLSANTIILSYGALIVLANYLIERKAAVGDVKGGSFPIWLKEHREVC